MSEAPKSWHERLLAAGAEMFKEHPSHTLTLASLVGIWMLMRERPELVAAFIATGVFKQLPSGWVVLAVGFLIIAVIRLSQDVQVARVSQAHCEAERITDRAAAEAIHLAHEKRIRALSRVVLRAVAKIDTIDRRKTTIPVNPDRRLPEDEGFDAADLSELVDTDYQFPLTG